MENLVRASLFRVLEPFLVIKKLFEMRALVLEFARGALEMVCGLHQLSSGIAAPEVNET